VLFSVGFPLAVGLLRPLAVLVDQPSAGGLMGMGVFSEKSAFIEQFTIRHDFISSYS
jgi:hypothetical protein